MATSDETDFDRSEVIISLLSLNKQSMYNQRAEVQLNSMTLVSWKFVITLSLYAFTFYT